MPAVRFRVIDKDNPKGRLLAPWDHPGDRDLARRARLQVFGTVAYPPRADTQDNGAAPGSGWFGTGSMDGYRFLQQVLSGHRTWYLPRALGHPSGLWALDTDVADYRTFRSRQHDTTARRSRPQPDELATRPAPPVGSIIPLTVSLSRQNGPRPEAARLVATALPAAQVTAAPDEAAIRKDSATQRHRRLSASWLTANYAPPSPP